MMRCHYVDGPSGQIHYRQWRPEKELHSPLLCLHPAPMSGLFFSTVMPLLGKNRRVLAPDYPGYGGSEAAGENPTIEDYAIHMLALVRNIDIALPIQILGFHTGCLVAAEMSLQSTDLIDQMILIDVPFFTGEAQQKMLASAAAPMALSAASESIVPVWKSAVSAKVEAVGLERAINLLSEQLRVFPAAHKAFHAAFTYPCETRMRQLKGNIRVIATASGLHGATLKAAACIPGAVLEEVPEIQRAVFEDGATAIAARINRI